jgi:hypothetical protein
MNEKTLKKYTIIPDTLYVRRFADEQLEQIINEMERPGYVLVARQMGKTNLLFHAKRRLENSKRLFVYVDLSNAFSQEVDCYRNIIDCVIEPNGELLREAEYQISAIRNMGLPSHKEYSKCLLEILRIFTGDIVIILDEIDALRTAPYSDNVFAQIRSTYFARTNFPEYNRLTYVLSGVIEPSELIKEKNKSPFNIGEKIYLDDFTLDEHKNFISKSNINIDPIVSREIFEWTSGNPRLTFDICSDVEDFITIGEKITIDTINDLIYQKYLKTFDIAPIDHIRELVKSNTAIRKAIELIWNGVNEFSDDIKKRLYLYGIIGSNFNEDLKIKNKILKKALSIEWINSINKQTKNLLSYAVEKVENKDFNDAISLLTDYIMNHSPNESESELANYYIGLSYYHLSETEKALQFFSKEYKTLLYQANARSFLGFCHLKIGNVEKGIEILETVIRKKESEFAYNNALLNLGTHYIETEPKRSIELFTKLIDSVKDRTDQDNKEVVDLQLFANFYLARIHLSANDLTNALLHIKAAQANASNTELVPLYYLQYFVENDQCEYLIQKIVDTIIDNNLDITYNSSRPTEFDENVLFRCLIIVYNYKHNELFAKLLDYVYSNIYRETKSKNEIIFLVANKANSSTAISMLQHIIAQGTQNENITLVIKSIRTILDLTLDNTKLFEHYLQEYVLLFENHDFNIEFADIRLFAYAVKKKSDKNKIDEGLYLCSLIEKRFKNLHEDLAFEILIIFYYYASLSFSKRNYDNATKYAKKSIEILQSSTKKATNLVDEKGLAQIANQMKQIIQSSQFQTPIITDKKYGRNEKVRVEYTDGTIKEAKYKKIEADVLAERCIII